MNASTITPGTPADALAASARVQQLQAIIAKAEGAPSSSSFADALNSARSQPAGAATPAPVATAAAYPSAGAGAGVSPSGTPLAASTTYPTYPTAESTNVAYPSGESASPIPIPAVGAYPSASPVASPVSAYPSASALTSPLASAQSSPYDPLIERAAVRNGLDPAILHGLIQQESGFDPNARSGAGALGLTQLMPGTASSLGVTEPLDPTQSIEGGARYLSGLMQQFGGNAADALAAYNAGPGAVSKYGGVPPYAETQEYVSKVLGYAEAYRHTGGLPATGAIA
jgi:soluble lytic murein transglycosylase-like protein